MRSKLILSIIFLFISAFSSAESDFILIKNINVVDVIESRIKPNQDILIAGGKILAVKNNLQVPGNQVYKTFNGSGLYATPGLIDMHVHMDLWNYGVRADEWALPLFIANGVTTVRDAGGSSLTLMMRKEIQSGKRIGPRMIIGTPFMMSQDVPAGSNAFTAKTPEEARAKIGAYFSQGYDYVKTNYDVTPLVLKAAADFTKSQGKYLMGHPIFSQDPGGWVKIEYAEVFKNYKTVEHTRWFFGDYLQSTSSPHYHTASAGALFWYSLAYPDYSKLPSLLQNLKASGLPVTPTLTPVNISDNLIAVAKYVKGLGLAGFRKHPRFRFLPDYYYSNWLAFIDANVTDEASERVLRQAFANEERVLRALDQADLPILVGTDIPARPTMVHGFSMHDEMLKLRVAGVSTWGILRGATISAAEALNLQDHIGSIRPNLQADILVTQSNPINDIRALSAPQAVIAKGHLFNRADLNNLLLSVERTVRALENRRLPLNPEALSCGSIHGHKH